MTTFKRALLASTVALGFGAALTPQPAAADVLVGGSIFKLRDKVVLEYIGKETYLGVDVVAKFDVNNAAEAEQITNQSSDDNTVYESDAKHVSIANGSIRNNNGVTEVNQDAGNMANQANAVAVAVDGRLAGRATTGHGSSGVDASFTDAQAGAEQISFFNHVDAEYVERKAGMDRSVALNRGVTLFNQNAGNMNNQVNALALAASFGAVAALSEADLGQFNTANSVDHTDGRVELGGTMAYSANANSGITAVNQSAGNMNNQATVISFSGAAAL